MKHVYSVVMLIASVCVASSAEAISGMGAEDSAYLQKHLPGLIQGPSDSPPITKSSDYLPLKETNYVFVRPSGAEVTISMKPSDRSPGEPVGTKSGGWRLESVQGPTRYIRVDDEGARPGLVIPTDVSKTRALITRHNPPEPLLIEGVDKESWEMGLKIYDLHDPSVLAHSGTLTVDWADLGSWRVKTPAGEFSTRLIRVKYDGKISAASVTGIRYTFYAPNVGPVAFTDAREVSAMLVYHDDSDHAGVLKSLPK